MGTLFDLQLRLVAKPMCDILLAAHTASATWAFNPTTVEKALQNIAKDDGASQ